MDGSDVGEGRGKMVERGWKESHGGRLVMVAKDVEADLYLYSYM